MTMLKNKKGLICAIYRLVLVVCACIFLSSVAFAAPGDIVTIAGGGVGDGGISASAILGAPNSVFRDSHGNLFIADSANHRIRKVDPNGIISTVAGSGTSGFSGDGGSALSANLNYPTAVYVDPLERIYIADTYNHRIRVVDISGVITTVAGNGIQGYSGDGGLAINAQLNSPLGITADASGMIYIADYGNHRIRTIGTSGVINTIAGTGVAGFSGDAGSALSASLNGPIGMSIDGMSNLIIADYNNHRIRKIDSSGVITTIAGNGTAGYSGDNEPATLAGINGPCGISVDYFGNVLFADQNNNRIRKIDTGGVITTLAGNGTAGYSGDGTVATSASINRPTGVEVDSSGNVYVADLYNNRIRKVDFGGTISTIAGNGTPGFTGDGGLATSAALLNPSRVVLDSTGNIYISDKGNFRVRKITSAGMISTVAGNGTSGSSGDGGQAISAQLSGPTGLALNPAGDTLYIADPPSNRIRQIYLPDGYTSTVFGNGTAGYYGDGRYAIFGSTINHAAGVTAKPGSNMIYFADTGNQRVRSANDYGNGMMNTEIGVGAPGAFGDGGYKTSAWLNNPVAIAFDPVGQLYISDRNNNRIRKVDAYGTVSTYAGNGEAGYAGDGGAATSASLNSPGDIAFDASGNLYIADTANQRIRKVDTNGVITTVAGNGIQGFSGDNGAATSASLNNPEGVYVDASGNILIADSNNHRIRKVFVAIPPTGSITINSGMTSTNTASVTLMISCTSQSGNCIEMQLSDDAISWSASEAYTANKAWTLASGDGTKHVYVKFRDEAGTWSYSYSDSIILDTTAPIIIISSPQAYTNITTPLLSYSLSDGTATAIKVDGVPVTKVSGNYLDALQEGLHTIRVEVVDALGNTGFAEQSFTVDTIPPAISIISPEPGNTNQASPLLSYTVNEGGVTVKVDGLAVSKVSGNRLSALANGAHTVRVESRDMAGNIGIAEVSFSVDAPIISSEDFETGDLTSLPWGASGNGLWSVKNTVKHGGSFAAEAPVSILDSQSAVMEVSMLCTSATISFWYSVSSETNYDYLTFYVDGVQQGRWSGTVSWAQATYAVTAGTHTFKWVYSKDSSVSSGSDTAWVDDIVFPVPIPLPTVSISAPVAGTTNDNRPVLSYTASNGTVVVKVDGVVVNKVSGNTLDLLPDGTHTLRVEATNSGGTGFAETVFTVDTVPPRALRSAHLSAGDNHSMAIRSDNSLWGWGSNADGQLGLQAGDALAPVRVGTDNDWLTVRSGGFHTVALKTDGTLWAWGSNSHGELGDGTTVAKSAPVKIGTDSDWSFVSPGQFNTAALKKDGSLWTWGYNYAGKLGDGTTIDQHVPVRIGNDNNWLMVAAQGAHSMAIKTDGTLWGWGGNYNGQLGNGTTADISIPVQIGSDTDWVDVTVGYWHTIALKSDGSLWSWGANGFGALGDGTTTSRSTPAQIGSNTTWIAISAQKHHSLGLRSDGTLWSWGWNGMGQLGDGTTVDKSSPVQVGSGKVWIAMSAGGAHTLALASDDSLWAWGYNPYGQVGDGTPAVFSKPFPVHVLNAVKTVEGITIRSTNRIVNSAEVMVDLAAIDCSGVVEMQLSNDGRAWSDPEPYKGTKPWTLAQGDGIKTVSARFKDGAGKWSDAFTDSIVLDTTAPAVAITSPAPGTGSNRTPVLTYTANDGTVIVKVDGLVVGKVSGDTLDSLDDGSHVVWVQATDSAGNAGFAETTFTIDTVAPAVAITSPVSGPTSNRPVLAFTVSDGAVTVKVDGVTISKISGDIMDQLADGVHTVRVEATDVVGNVGFSEVSFSVESYVVTMNAGVNGSISGPPVVNYGGSAAFTIAPAVGYHVADVLVDSVSIGALTNYSFTNVIANHAISASFAINSYSITATSGANGRISGSATVNYGDSAAYTITPAVGYHVADVLVDGVSVGSATSYNFSNVTGNHTISASFAINSYSITATAGANGSISGPATVTYGGNATYTITPSAGYCVVGVLVDGVSVGSVTSYSFNNVTINHTISATFGALADLIANSASGPSSATRGKSISVSSSVKNQGGGSAGSFTVSFYLSKDTAVNSSDTLLGAKTVTSLNTGSTVTLNGSFTVPSGIATGKYYVGVIVDSGSAIVESNESNNSKAARSSTTIR